MIFLFTLVMVLETAHDVAPTMLAWSHPGYRALALQRRWRTLGLPICLMSVAVAVGLATSLGFTSYMSGRTKFLSLANPLSFLMLAYAVWNIYHFGMQNFGLAAMWGWRRIGLALCIVTMLGMALLPLAARGFVPFVIGTSFFLLPHWVGALWLATRTSVRRLRFIGAALLLGASVGYLVYHSTPSGNVYDPRWGVWVPLVMALRIGMSFTHFCYDSWMWKFSDPEIKALTAAPP